MNDWLARGSLRDLLNKRKDKKVGLPLLQVKHYLRDMLKALSYCHQKGVFHLDFKPENIMINKYNQAILTNFGFSVMLRSDEIINTAMSSLVFFAPEMFTSEGSFKE